ncbi:MAG: hypothetical protein ABEL51_10205 [Salinibacter sp.]
MIRTRSFVLCLAVVGLALLSGCRTYGDGKYGTEKKTYKALQRAVQSFEKDLKQATSDLHRLEEAAAQADTLRALADQYQTYLEEHKSLLKKERRRIDRLSADASYRSLHSAYGATITEHRLMKEKYQRVIRSVYAAVQGTTFAASAGTSQNRQYTIRPINFPKQEDNREKLTMEQALQGL